MSSSLLVEMFPGPSHTPVPAPPAAGQQAQLLLFPLLTEVTDLKVRLFGEFLLGSLLESVKSLEPFKEIKAISGFHTLHLVAQELCTEVHVFKTHTPSLLYVYSCAEFLQQSLFPFSYRRHE